MKKNDGWHHIPRPVTAWLMMAALALALVSGIGHAATAVGTASATVVDSVAVITVSPPAPVATPLPVPAVVLPPPVLSGTVFTVERFTSSLSTSAPLLRAATPPAASGGDAVQAAAAGEGAAPGATVGPGGTGAAPPAASTATVNITRKPDGSLAVSGGSGLTFAVSQPVNGTVNIEYN